MKKRGMESEMVGWSIIAIVVLVIILVGFFVLKGKGEGALDFLKNLFRLKG
ncbi:hypothetical protein HN832_00700 [archaeon]|jgi:hypothetical protein|nr:hypothetical protein [archaeon]MBT4373859.1 hypothetical protein [archaeon]MBT4532381.1 hypothetical protein [archaeon]MBT7001762.1 hypothetical protein [archaeon]MBT7281913.1 hypothetical protein [archaeon]